jgi:hypothetical protein
VLRVNPTFKDVKVIVPPLPDKTPEAWCHLCKDFKPISEFYFEKDRGVKGSDRLMPRTICKMHDKKLRMDRKRKKREQAK